MRTADAVMKTLEQHVDAVFYLPGGGSSHLVDALSRSRLRRVSMLHEQGAGYAAVGYAMLHGLGVCLTTSGPGATNAVTPCLAAWMDSVPVLFISGQVARPSLAFAGQRSRGTQEARIIQIVTPITKRAVIVENREHALSELAEMITLAKSGRPGPVWLDIPNDVQAEEV